jgi:predicted DNA-binding protein (MmcQ/YjbR family)
MHVERLREYCLLKKGVTEGMPFGPNVLVFKVMDKMFALCGLDNIPPTVNLKCAPDYALQLREQHPEISPGYHMNKQHWNTVQLEGGLSEPFLEQLIDDSYTLIVNALPKNKRLALSNL